MMRDFLPCMKFPLLSLRKKFNFFLDLCIWVKMNFGNTPIRVYCGKGTYVSARSSKLPVGERCANSHAFMHLGKNEFWERSNSSVLR